jgi:hypothetical protein
MSDQDENKPYVDAIANLRDTAKWIISSSAALGALILGGTSLNGLGALDPGLRLFLAVASSLISIVLVGLIMILAVRVISSTTGISFGDLVTDRRYCRHRQYIENYVLVSLQPEFQTFARLRNAFDAGRAALPAGADAFLVCQRYVMLTLTIAKWLEVGYRFRTMMIGFVASLVPILICVYGFIWAANPPKEIGKDLERPLVEAVAFPDEQLATLKAAGFALNCLRPTMGVLIYKERPADVVEAYSLPATNGSPPVTCPVRKLVYDSKHLTILQVQ